MQYASRREFLKFLGRGAVVAATSNSFDVLANSFGNGGWVPKSITPNSSDDLVLAPGLKYNIIAKFADPLRDNLSFGTNNDYLAFFPDKDGKSGLLWVNHESLKPLFVSGFAEKDKTLKTRPQVEAEMHSVGGSIIKIKQDEKGQWGLVKNHPDNKRLDAKTLIPFAWDEPIAGFRRAQGTFANCAGGITPWGTVLTCEENYDTFYGERNHETGELLRKGNLGWEQYFNNPPEHYGWVVEVNPKTGDAKKLIALGRCSHECATVFQTKSGRLVVYTGDDANDQCLYKFISERPGSLERGELFVADTINGKWLSLDFNKQEVLKNKFKSQTEVLVRLREAAALVGGTPLDRPEDIEIDPANGNVYVTLTNNKPKGNLFGSILKIEEGDPDKLGTSFKASTFLAGGEATGFACPDNLAFDPKGNLWFTSDMAGSSMNKGEYAPFKNNGLFMVPMKGKNAGKAIRIASAPIDAEFTGPFFTADGKTLFLSVQHPGEESKTLEKLTSNWPEGGSAIPKSAVVAITGF